MTGATEREALALHYDPEAFEDHPIERRSPLAAIQWGARRKLAQEAADRVLSSGWLAARDKRVKAEAWRKGVEDAQDELVGRDQFSSRTLDILDKLARRES